MFVLSEHPKRGTLKIPIYVWLPDIAHLEEGCLEQALNLSELPFALNRIALMPDTHQGFGMPIGGVLATREVIIPNAVGVDIGCGVAFCRTSLTSDSFSRQLLTKWVEQILASVPQGFTHHSQKQPCQTLDDFQKNHPDERQQQPLWKEIDRGYYQIGTLGGGNHFIEFQTDNAGHLCLMVHSGSRNFGYQIARYFNNVARNNRKNWQSSVPKRFALDYLPEGSREGLSYIHWMQLARQFARENREKILDAALRVLAKTIPQMEVLERSDVHHNDANRERHDGEWVWVHRKGAIKAGEGEKGLIPGAMGRSSYVVEGRGNQKAFLSCSHGAGRAMSRKQALHQYSPASVLTELEQRDMILGKRQMKDVAEEAPMAYKDIDFVIREQLDLIKIIDRLTGKAVIKG
jgi:tRNA-splicing ligase RtcB (3'-phosphate/5'-hydroxy nucleic acid ligase)